MATAPFAVEVLPVNTATAPFAVTVAAGSAAPAPFSVQVLPAGTLALSADRTSVQAGDTVTITSSGTITSWSANQGVTLTGTGSSRSFVAPRFPDTTTVTIAATGPGGTATTQVTVKGQPSIYRGGAWTPTTVLR